MSNRPGPLSPAPVVRLVKSFASPFDNAVATARTCYSARGIVTDVDVSGAPDLEPERLREKREKRDELARDLYAAGHHTTLQHAHFQFALENVSRQFIWSFLHSHPFYNSEQVSQRYVEVRPGAYFVPPLGDDEQRIYVSAVAAAEASYRALIEQLLAPVAGHYYRRFPGRRRIEKYARDVKKRAQEAARYVLPVATFAHLYHTVSGITLLRYRRLQESLDVPFETRLVVERMVAELLAHAPEYRLLLEEPLPLEQTPEHAALAALPSGEKQRQELAAEFDRSLDGRTSRLVDHGPRAEETVAAAVREVLGLPRASLGDEEAIALVLDPARNRYLGETLVLSTHSKLMRTLYHARYVFRKKLSHTADSQDQRHRMTPASRPILCAQAGAEPDYVTPAVVREDEPARALYERAMERAWSAVEELRGRGVPDEFSLYLLPNAVALRFTESADLLHLHHKLAMRLCYNAQEEIWQASKEEAEQVAEVHPRLGRWLLPPCGLRARAGARPICPEGARYCGEPVWRYALSEYRRVI